VPTGRAEASRWPNIGDMHLLARGREEFVVRAAVLGSVLEILNFAYTKDWGWILAALMAPALPVRIVWRSMPGWLLLTWVTVPTLVGDALVVTESAYMVVLTALAIVAATGAKRTDTAAMAVCLVSPFFIWALNTNDWHRGIGAWLWSAGILVAWVLGRLVGRQQALITELERTRTELAEAAVTAERQRIARDLHDLVGHSFSVVLLHLSGARMNLASSPDEATEALRQAEAVGRTGMDALREALSLMYRGTDAPLPTGRGELDQLIAAYRDAGMDIDLAVAGAIDGVSATQRIVLHDVLREALTNVVKHARTPEAEVRIGVDRDGIALHVRSRLGAHASRPGTGMGLSGLEHRVTAINGTFDAGPEHDRWVVRACLPAPVHGLPA
jgi:signal transduction histidine kinase